MGERIVVSGDGGVRVYASPPGRMLTACGLDGAGAICAARDCLFVASDRDNAIWRLDKNTLMPTGIFAGGPGISQMLSSGDGKRLYALCSDADSLLIPNGRIRHAAAKIWLSENASAAAAALMRSPTESTWNAQ